MIIAGALLGIASIVRWRVPLTIAQVSGLMVLGSHTGYMVLALIAAWNGRKWRGGFIRSSVTMGVATIVYYSGALLLYVFEEGFETSPAQTLRNLVLWLVIGVAVSSLAATAVWMAREAKSKLLNYGIFVMVYLGMLGVIYFFQGTHMVERVLSVVVITAVLAVGLIKNRNEIAGQFRNDD